MEKAELLKKLEECKYESTEEGHYEADMLLLEYINDEEIERAYKDVPKWYA